jgi:hypothetical protein
MEQLYAYGDALLIRSKCRCSTHTIVHAAVRVTTILADIHRRSHYTAVLHVYTTTLVVYTGCAASPTQVL